MFALCFAVKAHLNAETNISAPRPGSQAAAAALAAHLSDYSVLIMIMMIVPRNVTLGLSLRLACLAGRPPVRLGLQELAASHGASRPRRNAILMILIGAPSA